MNKIIWIYWHQGWDMAPEIALKCKSTWILKNTDWEVRPLCKDSLSNYLDLDKEFPGIWSKQISLASMSDIIRISLLHKYGGVWADSTVLCRTPLDKWIKLYEDIDFFAFSKPTKTRLVSSWFLIAKKSSYIIEKWFEMTKTFWTNRKTTNDYYWFHHFFNDLYDNDQLFRNLWNDTPKMSAYAPCLFASYDKTFYSNIDYDKIETIKKVQSPVFKLTHKYDHGKEKENTVLDHILNGNLDMVKPKILVTWYGSFENGGTIGDYLAVKTLTNFLMENDFDFDCATYKHFEDLQGHNLHLDSVDSCDYDVLLFCCGPILKIHKPLNDLFNRFKNAYKVGIGVSLFPQDHFNYYNPFNHVLAREFGDINYEDIAIIAPSSNKALKKRSPGRGITVGMTLRNAQGEYGVENCKSTEANSYLMDLAIELSRTGDSLYDKMLNLFLKKGTIIEIDNHLEKSGLSPQQIESKYSQCDIVLTTRFHGSMIALRNNIPFMAIDQILNGAKVFKLVSQTEYPFVWKINDVSYKVLKTVAKELLRNKHTDKIISAKLKSETGAKLSLKNLHAHLLCYCPKRLVIKN